MSVSPYLLGELLHELAQARGYHGGSIFDQNFGIGVLPEEVLHPASTTPLFAGYIRPWRNQPAQNSGSSHVHSGKEGFKVNLDVQQFKPDEIKVKHVDNFVVIEGKHEEREDEHGFISRGFQRRYRIPDDVDVENLVSKLSSDGVLSIEAPKKVVSASSKERVIQITRTNAPAVTSKSKTEKINKQDTEEKMDQ